MSGLSLYECQRIYMRVSVGAQLSTCVLVVSQNNSVAFESIVLDWTRHSICVRWAT